MNDIIIKLKRIPAYLNQCHTDDKKCIFYDEAERICLKDLFTQEKCDGKYIFIKD